MTEEQVNWAKQHDWFCRVALRYGHNAYMIVCRGDIGEAEEIAFTDYKKLKEWAGY